MNLDFFYMVFSFRHPFFHQIFHNFVQNLYSFTFDFLRSVLILNAVKWENLQTITPVIARKILCKALI